MSRKNRHILFRAADRLLSWSFFLLHFIVHKLWLRDHQTKLQAAIIETIDFSANFIKYPPGKEVALVKDLSAAIAPIWSDEHPINPVLVAALLSRIGWESSARATGKASTLIFNRVWEKALAWDRDAARGEWQGALTSFERAVSRCQFIFLH